MTTLTHRARAAIGAWRQPALFNPPTPPSRPQPRRMDDGSYEDLTLLPIPPAGEYWAARVVAITDSHRDYIIRGQVAALTHWTLIKGRF